MPAGRPRAFDESDALEKALKVFWEKGFEGASLDDLTQEMGINRPSLYGTFGNKEELFRKAIDRYTEKAACHFQQSIAEPTARAVVERLLRGGVERMTDEHNPKGCFMVQGALACGETGQRIRQEVIQRRKEIELALRERFERAHVEGDLPPTIDAADLARYVTAISHGMAVQAAGGASRDDLLRLVEFVLGHWPTG